MKTLRDCYDALGEWALDNQGDVLSKLWDSLDGAPTALCTEHGEDFYVRQPWNGVLIVCESLSGDALIEVHSVENFADLPAVLSDQEYKETK